jgi:Mn-containing catalase
MLGNGPDGDHTGYGGDISTTPFEAMTKIRNAASFPSNGGGVMPSNSNRQSWNQEQR